MATFYVDQRAVARNLSQGTGYSLNSGLNTDGARIHVKVATYIALGTEVATSVIELFQLPKGARILRGSIAAGSIGAATLSIGTDVALVKEDGVTVLANAGPANIVAGSAVAGVNVPIAVTRALGYLGLTTALTTFSATVSGATLSAGAELVAHIEYMQN